MPRPPDALPVLPLEIEGPVVVGVSGGMDSIVLLHALVRQECSVQAAHVNYGMRGKEADADEALVSEICEKWHVPLVVHRVEPGAVPSSSRQAWARHVRYAFFERVAREAGITQVAVAHHANDQAETVLLNLLRGTGLPGLGGMRPSRTLQKSSAVHLVRPLLGYSKKQLQGYAAAHNLAWREDASNADLRYRRAEVRKVVLPQLRRIHGDEVVAQLVDIAADAQSVLDGWENTRRALFEAAARKDGLAIDEIRGLGPHWQGRLILDALAHFLPAAPCTAAVAAQLVALMGAQVGRRVSFGAGTVWRERDQLRFVPAARQQDATVKRLYAGDSVHFPGGDVRASEVQPAPVDVRESDHTCWVDAESISLPLTVRPWQPGDRMQPLGMSGRKKVSDLLTDAHWPASERKHALVVCTQDEVVWVPGVRLSERVKIRQETRHALYLTWVPPLSILGSAG